MTVRLSLAGANQRWENRPALDSYRTPRRYYFINSDWAGSALSAIFFPSTPLLSGFHSMITLDFDTL